MFVIIAFILGTVAGILAFPLLVAALVKLAGRIEFEGKPYVVTNPRKEGSVNLMNPAELLQAEKSSLAKISDFVWDWIRREL